MNHRNSLSDAELLRLIIARDADALSVLYDRHASILYDLILRIVCDPEIAAGLLEETFWMVWKQAPSSAREQVKIGWLCRIARELSLDQLRVTRSSSEVIPASPLSRALAAVASRTDLSDPQFQGNPERAR